MQNAGLTCWRVVACWVWEWERWLCVFRRGPEAICRWRSVGGFSILRGPKAIYQ